MSDSYNKNTTQVIVLLDSYFEVMDHINLANSLHIIYMKEVQPLLEPPSMIKIAFSQAVQQSSDKIHCSGILVSSGCLL
jgi:hypothetical protein